MTPTADPLRQSNRCTRRITRGWRARLKKNDSATIRRRSLASPIAHSAANVTRMAPITCQTVRADTLMVTWRFGAS